MGTDGRDSLSAAAGRGGGSAGAGAERCGGSAGVGGRGAASGGAGSVGGAAGFAGVAVGPGVGSAGGGSGGGAAAGVGGSGAGDRVVLLVPVPSARRVVGARGHDPARRIALAAAGELRRGGVAARVVGVLRQRRAVADQSGLDSRERLENLSGALEVVPGGGRLLLGGPVVLVDDLMTTGASLTEAARAVRAATAVAAEAVARGRASGSVAYGSAVTPVYGTAAREGTGGRRNRSAEADVGGGPGMVQTYRAGDVICAAVVAASPSSFEINRN
ncbi:ComF family protein [Streptomyces sp. NBC_00490]